MWLWWAGQRGGPSDLLSCPAAAAAAREAPELHHRHGDSHQAPRHRQQSPNHHCLLNPVQWRKVTSVLKFRKIPYLFYI